MEVTFPDIDRPRVGTAGWAIPAPERARFPGAGSLLERYAGLLDCAEINSCFYRSHRAGTYARWADTVPASFAFCAKVPKDITHVRRLVDCAEPFERFLDETAALGAKRRVLLVQLPPSLAYDAATAGGFLEMFRARYEGFAVCEPRHPSWFAAPADAALDAYRIGRVAADPALCAGADEPGGWPGIVYYRLHGSPRTYWSRYEPAALARTAGALAAHAAPERWAILDNTAAGAGLANALELREMVTDGPGTFADGRARARP